ncbi:MAG: hypothetical protein KUG79_06835 [Pseudomonadales bacterium]|nr:hypothetical protein [Pseudomonadales bacterium]
MRYIPLKESNKDALKVWLEKANEILAALKAEPDAQKRKMIIRRNSSHWRDTGLLDFLKDLSNGKCWYTEAKFTAEYPHLEHFRPKSCARNENWGRCHEGYWWLAFDIDNYRLSKPMPNTRKGSYFPLRRRAMAICEPGIAVTQESPMFLDPTIEDDVALISFNSHGKPEPAMNPVVDIDEWDRQRIAFSIKRYGLDDKDLCNERKELWVSLTAQFNEYASQAKKHKREQCLLAKGKASQILENLKPYLSPNQIFLGLIKACFNSHPVGQLLLKNLATYPQAA